MDGEMPGEEKKRYVFQFDPIAKVYATKSKEGEMTLEGGRYRCAVMCPAVPEWQQFIYHMVERLAGHGFQAVYHDEVTTAQPIPCFDPNHGHPLNSPRNWLELGYWKMFEKIATLRKKYPDLCHDSEKDDPGTQNSGSCQFLTEDNEGEYRSQYRTGTLKQRHCFRRDMPQCHILKKISGRGTDHRQIEDDKPDGKIRRCQPDPMVEKQCT